MSSLTEVKEVRGTNVRIEKEMFYVRIEDGREVGVPYEWFWRLADATPDERKHWNFIADGKGIEWELIDEHISVAGILKGNRGPKRPVDKRQKRA